MNPNGLALVLSPEFASSPALTLSLQVMISWCDLLGEDATSPLHDSAIIICAPGMHKSELHKSQTCQFLEPLGSRIHKLLLWNAPFALFSSGSGVSDLERHWTKPPFIKCTVGWLSVPDWARATRMSSPGVEYHYEKEGAASQQCDES